MKTRYSGIELYKLIGMIFIVVHHVLNTLCYPSQYIVDDYTINLELATSNIQHLFLSILHYGGSLGNTIFFVCSAWFLLDSNKTEKRKILQIIIDVWIISVLILIIVMMIREGNVDVKLIIRQLFPTIFSNNWYITCYIIFYFLYPYLNWLIEKMEKEELFLVALFLFILYFGINFIQHESFFASPIINWISIYFIMAYMKNYLSNISKNIRINIIFLASGIIGNIILIFITNLLGQNFSVFNEKLLYWEANNPFILVIAIAGLNLFSRTQFYNIGINSIARLSLYIYIIHENMLLREIYRPMLLRNILVQYGYNNIFFLILFLGGGIFVTSVIFSLIYVMCFRKISIKLCDIIYPFLCTKYNGIKCKFISIK